MHTISEVEHSENNILSSVEEVDMSLIDNGFISETLKHYWVSFIKSAKIIKQNKIILSYSRLGVDKPWYCDDTGHMNAVELNLSFNQLMYVTIGHSICNGWIPELNDKSQDYFFEKYWEDFLITKIESKFKAPVNVSEFSGLLRITKIRSSSSHLWFNLDYTVVPGSKDYPQAEAITHAHSTMTLAITNYNV